jgi:hypothetical protein
MSAFVLSNEHIAAMMQATTPRYPGNAFWYYHNNQGHYKNPTDIGQILMNQNYRSVNHRYSETEPTPRFHNYAKKDYTPVEILKACDSYSYQSCETEDWDQTEAFAILQAIRSTAIGNLPGYEKAQWSID